MTVIESRYAKALAVCMAAASVLLFGLIGKAQAADCMSYAECLNQYTTQTNESNMHKAAANSYRQKAFIAASQHQDQAAGLYSAAASNEDAQAGLLAAAASNAANRARFFLALLMPGDASPGELAGDPQAAGDGADPVPSDPGQAHAASFKTKCKNAPNATWGGGGARVYAQPGTWCYLGNRVTRVDLPAGSYRNDVVGPAALGMSPSGCNTPERSFYNYRGKGSESGRKITLTCYFSGHPNIVGMHCTTSMYFHAGGSTYYQKKLHCHLDTLFS